MSERECLSGADRKKAELLLSEIEDDGKLEFLGTNEDRDFIANCQKCRHLHWPGFWLDRLQEIHEKICE